MTQTNDTLPKRVIFIIELKKKTLFEEFKISFNKVSNNIYLIYLLEGSTKKSRTFYNIYQNLFCARHCFIKNVSSSTPLRSH